MRKVYRVLAVLVMVEVIVQAAAIAFAVAGLGVWVDKDGGVLDKAAFESENLEFTGVVGFMVHGINGMMIIPLIGLLLLIVSFFAKVPKGIPLAAAVLVLIVLQVALGIFGHETPYAGLLHGINAFLVFGAAMAAFRAATEVVPAERVTSQSTV